VRNGIEAEIRREITMSGVSRREFVRLGAVGAAGVPFVLESTATGAAAPTAQAIVGRIRQNVGVEWNPTTVDTFKAGDPSTTVTGIVTTSLATIAVLRRAIQVGANLIVTSGPTFYSRADTPTLTGRRGGPPPAADPVFAAKSDFIAQNRLVVWRFSDHWRARMPDPFAQGMVDALGWAKYRVTGDPRRVTVPAITIETLATDLKAKLNARGGIRVIGKPDARVQKIAVLPGTIPIQTTLTVLPDVDVLITGEIREWESSEYARDLVHAGRNKGLILVGRSLSEEPGMNNCAEWLKTIASDVPVRWVPAGDPYWRPTT
jgi:putative NIF3 family GTP cyclohydrolase 1 type 2